MNSTNHRYLWEEEHPNATKGYTFIDVNPNLFKVYKDSLSNLIGYIAKTPRKDKLGRNIWTVCNKQGDILKEYTNENFCKRFFCINRTA